MKDYHKTIIEDCKNYLKVATIIAYQKNLKSTYLKKKFHHCNN